MKVLGNIGGFFCNICRVYLQNKFCVWVRNKEFYLVLLQQIFQLQQYLEFLDKEGLYRFYIDFLISFVWEGQDESLDIYI